MSRIINYNHFYHLQTPNISPSLPVVRRISRQHRCGRRHGTANRLPTLPPLCILIHRLLRHNRRIDPLLIRGLDRVARITDPLLDFPDTQQLPGHNRTHQRRRRREELPAFADRHMGALHMREERALGERDGGDRDGESGGRAEVLRDVGETDGGAGGDDEEGTGDLLVELVEGEGEVVAGGDVGEGGDEVGAGGEVGGCGKGSTTGSRSHWGSGELLTSNIGGTETTEELSSADGGGEESVGGGSGRHYCG